jgi:hypothetical protein
MCRGVQLLGSGLASSLNPQQISFNQFWRTAMAQTSSPFSTDISGEQVYYGNISAVSQTQLEKLSWCIQME